MDPVVARRTVLIALLISLALIQRVAAPQDWPEFRGPTGQGHSNESGLPFDWSESRNVIWKTPVPGSGWSSPVVAEGRIWVTTAIQERGAASLRALAFDVVTGREVVNVEVFRIRNAFLLNPKNSFASPTPLLSATACTCIWAPMAPPR